MDLQELFGKTILIRLTEDRDAFVSTVRYGPLRRRSETWSVTSPEEAQSNAPVDDVFWSEE